MTSLADAEEALYSTSTKANFQRLMRLLMCGGLRLLRETFDSIHSPADLPLRLSDPTIQTQLKGARLTRPEWNCLYPPGGVYGKSTDFDITLIFRLLRTICKLTPPPGPRGWDDLPNNSDHSLGADLVRIKYYRNEVYGHSKTMEITDTEFNDLWGKISEALIRIAAAISREKRDEWKKSIDRFRLDALTPEEERYIEELNSWYKQDMDVKSEVEKLKEDFKTQRSDIKKMHEEVTKQSQLLATLVLKITAESIPHGGSTIISNQPSSRPQIPQEAGETRGICAKPIPEQEWAEDDVSDSGELQLNPLNSPTEIQIWNVIISFKKSFELFLRYLAYKLDIFVPKHDLGSLLITAECSSLPILEGLWEDYRSGHLNAIAQEMLVTAEVLEKLDLTDVRLKTFISEEEYEKGKQIFMKHSDGTGLLQAHPGSIGFTASTSKTMDKAKLSHGIKMEGATPKTALEEFVKLLLENGGELELGRAVLHLSQPNRKLVSDYGALEFVKRFPQLFMVNQTRQRKSKVFVKLDVPLQFCPQAGETGGCTDRRCDQLHLCPFFVKESCKFGDKCKRSHDFRDEHTIRVVRHFRLDFLSSSLLQNILKIIVDEGEIQRAAANRSVPDICKFYNNKGACKKGELCPCLHVCEHFVDGDCKFGATCKRNHDFSDDHNTTVLEQYDMDGISIRRVLQFLRERERKRTMSASSDEDTTPLRGNLVQSPVSNTGGNFAMPPPTMQRSGSTHSLPEICKFYNNKSACKKGEQCHCLHVCEHFINGDCKFGEKCKRDHDFSNSHNRRILKENEMGDISELKVLERLQTRERKRTLGKGSNGERPEQLMSPLANAISNQSVQANSNADKDTEICGFNLRGNCNYGNSCINRHTELPYLWEFAVQGDDKWESFSSDLNMTLECAYCDVEKDNSETVTIKGSLCYVRFQDMTAVPLGSAALGVPNAKFPRVRRLSTISSVVAAAGHVFSTRWQWYWKDENGKWQSYDAPSDGHAVNTASSQCFERDYVAGKDTHPFSAGHHRYTLHFKEWCQQNDVHKTKRPVRRRPSEFVYKENMQDIVQRRRAAVMASSASSASAESERLPTHWTAIPEREDFSCVALQTISDEYKKTEKKFQETMDGSHDIISIERVQNPDLWIQYTQRKSRMAKKSGKEPEERQLFHGTNPDTAKAICQQGFDWRMHGKHGTSYGEGSYFACKANYSHRYSNHGVSRRGHRQMFLARVVVGSYTRGESSFTRPPPKDPSNPLSVLHDSCCDNIANPALFVVFENGQSYPEFLITYR